MATPAGALIGLILIRVLLVGAAITTLWTAWIGFYELTLMFLLTLGYFFYLTWKPVTVNEHLIDPERWDK